MDATDPARLRVAHDLAAAAFRDGVTDGRWEIVAEEWPHVTFAVAAGDNRKFGIRVELSGFAATAPAGTPWNLDAARPASLNELPTGARAEVVFRSSWSQQNTLTPYMATERVLLSTGHPEWATNYASRAWNPGRDLAFYLNQLHSELRTCSIPESTA